MECIYERNGNWNEEVENKVKEVIRNPNYDVIISHHCSERIVENYLIHKNCFKRRFNTSEINKANLLNGRILRAEFYDGKLKKARSVCKEILKLNNNDNTGARYLLMAIYATLE